MNARQQLTGLDHYWLPCTPNRRFQDHPKILAGYHRLRGGARRVRFIGAQGNA